MIYDYIIVGGGSAGSVLAHRLSARSANTVLLIEAGIDTPHGKVPAAVLDSYPGTAYLNPAYTWNRLKVTTEVISHNNPGERPPPLRTYEQARILGGGSSINGQLANRGAPTDYDEWASKGATGWDWNSVLPFFKKVERDMDFDDDWHGRDGRIPVRRIFPDLWPEHAKAVGKAFEQAGWKYLRDQNAGWEDGYFPITISNAYERRVSAAIGYLDPGTRMRPNLTISANTQAMELVFDGPRCTGVKALAGGRPNVFEGREIILSCGAIHSPAHLMRAGIGPAAHLRDLGIEVRSALPGVGQRLQDHPAVAVAAFLKPHARIIHDYSRRHIYTALRYSSGLPDIPAGDMFTVVTNKTSWHKVGEQIGSFIVTVYKTYSETGTVKLRSKDWEDEPQVDFNLLSDQRDLERMMDGVRRFGAMHLTPIMQAVTEFPFPASYSDKVRQVGLLSRKNKLITDALALALDGPAPLRKYIIENLVMEGISLQDVLRDDDACEAFVRRAAVGVWHASCTCRMGSEDDPMAVVDPAGRVRGVEGLRVVDASVFPAVPCANTNFPVLMTAEKMADAILHGN
ncbi:MAG TPA: GMC family oxidoreductase N-terminal domain-containing protein [Rhodopila sp.]|uniref:GMC family oxidoreductase n=1 Tax=Rhodopila sp. TaxID=2480087 RepID=UPI002CFB4D1B|nr:GMC family oxidoreductase N-terminal domain-containing protein [Rhodopila sp.]HVY14236.1 GMC family oxidoreductase N-terminal domain-containing protein [Rhodopila sp.]